MHVAPLTEDKIHACLALWQRTPGIGLRPTDDEPSALAQFVLRNPTTCIVAMDDNGAVIGTLLCGWDGRRAYIYHTAVAEEHRHQGIGAGMADALMDALRRLGVAKAALVAFRDNTAGNAFWARMGFAERTDLIYRDKWVE